MRSKIALKWGALLGASVVVWTLALHALGWYTTDIAKGQVADQVAIILPVIAIFLALRERRNVAGGNLTIGDATATGVMTGAVSIPITVGFLWLYHNVINPRWLEYVVAYERQRLAGAGRPPAEIEAMSAALTTSGTNAAQLVSGIVGTIVVSLVIGVLGWLVLRRWRRAPA